MNFALLEDRKTSLTGSDFFVRCSGVLSHGNGSLEKRLSGVALSSALPHEKCECGLEQFVLFDKHKRFRIWERCTVPLSQSILYYPLA